MKKTIAKNSFFNIIYTVSNILFPFLTSIYVSRILMPAGVGKVAGAQNIASYFVTIAALGLPSYGVREFAKIRDSKKERNTLFTELIIINIVSTTVVTIAYVVFLYFNHGFKGEWTLYGACGLLIILNYLNIDWVYQGLEEYGYIAGRNIAIKAISLLFLFCFVRSPADYVKYALISSLATGGNYIFNVIHSRKFVRLSFKGIQPLRHLKSVILIAAILFLSSIYSKIDITMLNVLATYESVGYYSYAQKTVNIVITLAAAVTAALLPRLSYYFENDMSAFYKLIDKGYQVLCLAVIPLCIGLFMVADQVVVFLYGEAFIPTAVTIRLMCPIILIKGFGDLLCYQMVYSTKNEKVLLPASTCASVINVIVNAILIPHLLQNGAVIASVVSEFVTNAIQLSYVKRRVHFSVRIKPLVVSAVSTVCMAISVLLIMKIHVPNFGGLVLEIIIGVCVYFLINIVLKNELIWDVMNKLRSRTD